MRIVKPKQIFLCGHISKAIVEISPGGGRPSEYKEFGDDDVLTLFGKIVTEDVPCDNCQHAAVAP